MFNLHVSVIQLHSVEQEAVTHGNAYELVTSFTEMWRNLMCEKL